MNHRCLHPPGITFLWLAAFLFGIGCKVVCASETAQLKSCCDNELEAAKCCKLDEHYVAAPSKSYNLQESPAFDGILVDLLPVLVNSYFSLNDIHTGYLIPTVTRKIFLLNRVLRI